MFGKSPDTNRTAYLPDLMIGQEVLRAWEGGGS